MLRVYARTREREKAWKLGGYATGASLIAAPFITMIFRGVKYSTPSEMLWTFSIILEAFCILPQLLLLRQTTVPTVIDSFYLLTLGSYRGFYIVNWIVRGVKDHLADPVAIIFGVVQTAFYIDFAWVYWSRQRVKLRAGGIVDSDDLRKGWLVNKVVHASRPGTEQDVEDGDGEADPAGHSSVSRWGARGVSVSADDTLEEHLNHQQSNIGRKGLTGRQGESQAMLAEGDGQEDFFSDADDDAPQLGQPDGRSGT